MNIYMIFDIKDHLCIDFPLAQFEKSVTELPISPWDRFAICAYPAKSPAFARQTFDSEMISVVFRDRYHQSIEGPE